MTIRVPFYVVDVFASQPLSGSPLPLLPAADGLDQAQLAAIAREFSQPETTFLLRPSLPGATVRIRSFTPAGAEVGGAGHNALGAWVWLEAAGRIGPDRPEGSGGSLAQEIGGRVLPVEVIRPPGQPAVIWMDQSPPRFGATVGDRPALAAALGLAEQDLAADEPAQVVSTGAAHLMVPARDRAAVDRAAPDPARLKALLHQAGGAGGYPLAARLAAAGQIPRQATVAIEQGHALGRPSRIQVEISGPRIRVGGSGLVVAEGTLTLP